MVHFGCMKIHDWEVDPKSYCFRVIKNDISRKLRVVTETSIFTQMNYVVQFLWFLVWERSTKKPQHHILFHFTKTKRDKHKHCTPQGLRSLRLQHRKFICSITALENTQHTATPQSPMSPSLWRLVPFFSVNNICILKQLHKGLY